LLKIISEGAIQWGLSQLQSGDSLIELGIAAESRFPGAPSGGIESFLQEVMAAREAGQRISELPPDQPIPLGFFPLVPEIANGPYEGARTIIPIEITKVKDGAEVKTWLITIAGTGTETLDELRQMAIDELYRRQGKSPTMFGELGEDMIEAFDFNILGAIKAF
jgi:hypothetical protein